MKWSLSDYLFEQRTRKGGGAHKENDVMTLQFHSMFFSLFSFSILVNMDDRMIEQFVDEDDFIINLDFDNQLGHFELTLQY